MTYSLFASLLSEAKEAKNLDTYVSERGWQEWMDDYSDNSDASAVTDVLNRIYEIGDMSIKELVDEFATINKDTIKSGVIPMRTLQGWKYGEREPAPYMGVMMAYIVFNAHE